MKITNVRTYKLENSATKIKGVASIVLDDEFIISGIKIIDGNNGLFVAMPNKKNEDGTYSDIAHPINKETREIIQNLVLEAYNNL